MNHPLVIEKPHRQGALRRFIQSIATLAIWVLWLYLLLPIFKLPFTSPDFSSLSTRELIIGIEIFAIALLLIAFISISFWLWAKYNTLLHRYHIKLQNRLLKKIRYNFIQIPWLYNSYTAQKNVQKAVLQDELANHFCVNLKALGSWQSAKQITIQLAGKDNIHWVKVSKSPLPENTARLNESHFQTVNRA